MVSEFSPCSPNRHSEGFVPTECTSVYRSHAARQSVEYVIRLETYTVLVFCAEAIGNAVRRVFRALVFRIFAFLTSFICNDAPCFPQVFEQILSTSGDRDLGQ